MDQIGTLELSWAQGYKGEHANYVDKDVICFQCGSCVKFIAEDGAETIFNFEGHGGIGAFAVHTSEKCFAVAEQNLNPSIYIYMYPTFRELQVLSGGAKLEFQRLVFSTSNYLATVSGVPDFELTLWDFTQGTKLATLPLTSERITSFSFNPANWRQMCVTTEKQITFLHTEQSDIHYIIQTEKVKLPSADPIQEDDEKEQDQSTRTATRMSRYTIAVPKAAIAGLVGDLAEQLEEIQDQTVHVVPVSQAWTPGGDIYIGCKGGQLLKIDGEVLKAKVLYYPPPPAQTPRSRLTSAGSKRASAVDIQSVADDFGNILVEGSLDCIKFHKRGLYAAGSDGVLRLIDTRSDDFNVIEQCNIGTCISSMSFSASYRHIAIGSPLGSFFLYEVGTPESLKLLKDYHHGQFISIGELAVTNNCVSVREDGMTQVWTSEGGQLLCSYSVGTQATSLACSPYIPVVAVGVVTGHICFIDFTNLEQPRTIQKLRIYQGPVKHLIFDDDGKYLISGSDDGHVFVFDGRPSKTFVPIGHTEVKGEVQAISTFSHEGKVRVVVMANTTGNKRNGADRITSFELSDDILRDRKKHVKNLRYEFRNESISKMSFKLGTACYGCAPTKGQIIYTLAQKSKKVNQLTLPHIEDLPKKRDDITLEPAAEYPGHQLPGGRVCLSPHHKWLATYGTDGSVLIRAVGNMDQIVSASPHDFRTGGVRSLVFSEDSHTIYTTGFDGILTCFTWNYALPSIGKSKSAVDHARAKKTRLMSLQKEEQEFLKKMEDWSPTHISRPTSGTAIISQEEKERQRRMEAVEKDEIYTTPTPTPSPDATWLQTQELESFKEEDKQYSEKKKKLREEIRDMRKTLQERLKINETLPEIERLNRHEFDLDIEEQNRLQAENDAEVQRIREEIEFDNLAKMYLRDMIKRECWDNMVVKGKSIQAFNSSLEVSNFPLRERSKESLKLLDTIQKRRRIEIQERAARKDTIDHVQKEAPTTADDDLGENEEENGKEQPSTTGSLGAQFGGGSDLFYSQFELHTREQKRAQVVLLEDAIHRIKIAFNKEFDEVYVRKEQEIVKIKEKNKRIRKILEDLEIMEEMIEPALGDAERPETLLEVQDDEVKVEKYLTPEQRKQKEEQDRIEAERRAKERGDNARDRALQDMMGGVLEIKKEDELKKDISKPSFMQSKAENEWTEDEQKIVKEYEKKVKELQEERDKYKKQLETELRKNQSLIVESMAAFDDTLNQIFMKKIKCKMVIYQEELKMLRLRYSMLVEEELETREKELNRLLEHKKHLKQLVTQAVAESRKNVDAFREQYDILTAEDKVMDKAFKREFADVSAVQQDQLYRLFRRRPRARAVKTETSVTDSSVFNPFADRPPTARQNSQAKSYMESAMEELDKPSNCPEGIETRIWERLCAYRKAKIDNEQLLKTKALVLAEMNAFLQARQEEDEKLRTDIDGILDTLNKLQEDKQRFGLNLEVQLLLKQGQVEIDAGSLIQDHRDSVLIHRSVVEDLNGTIKPRPRLEPLRKQMRWQWLVKMSAVDNFTTQAPTVIEDAFTNQLGESKIASMVESKDFRKGIIQLEWEHKKMLMQMEDFQNKMKDIQFMKVTREIQLFLNEADYDGKKSEEIGKLEQTVLTLKQHHEKAVKEKTNNLKELGKTIKQKEAENEELLKELEELNVSVYERYHVDAVNADKRDTSTGTEKRYKDIVQRRKLVDLAKAQAQEVAVLRAEVERLRMRTFPALVQVEH